MIIKGERGGCGFVATSDWTAAVGATGPQGEPGAQGPAGATGAVGPQGPQGPQGLQGPQGPQGLKGLKGDTGSAGAAATITVGSVTTGAAGASASVTNSGTASAAVLNFTIPQGAKGETGATGAQGPAGAGGTRGSGLLYDTRDGKLYRIQDFGAAGTWMIDNLVYAYGIENTDYKTTYPDKGVGERGFYYSGGAMQKTDLCPVGWHVPDVYQARAMVAALQEKPNYNGNQSFSLLGIEIWGLADNSFRAGWCSQDTWSGWDGATYWGIKNGNFLIRADNTMSSDAGGNISYHFRIVRCMKD